MLFGGINAYAAGSSVGLTVNSTKFKVDTGFSETGTGFGVAFQQAFGSGRNHGFRIGFTKEGAEQSTPFNDTYPSGGDSITANGKSFVDAGNTIDLLYFVKFGNPDGIRPFLMGGISRTDVDVGYQGTTTTTTADGVVGPPMPDPENSKDSLDFTGPTLVVGVEFPFSEILSGQVVYRYTDYGKADNDPDTYEIKTSGLQLGLNWNF